MVFDEHQILLAVSLLVQFSWHGMSIALSCAGALVHPHLLSHPKVVSLS
jgi:hypothetical protein